MTRTGRPLVSESAKARKCCAIVLVATKGGNVSTRKCKNRAKPGRDFCGIHLNKYGLRSTTNADEK